MLCFAECKWTELKTYSQKPPLRATVIYYRLTKFYSSILVTDQDGLFTSEKQDYIKE